MDDPVLVRCIQRLRQLHGQPERLGYRDRSGGQALGQRRSFDELQHERPLAVRLLDPVQSRDIRMI